MSGIATAIVGSAVVTGYLANKSQNKAIDSASETATQTSEASIGEIRRQFDAVQSLMKPFVDQGYTGLTQQGDLLGLNGPEKQQAAIDAINSGPEMSAMVTSGEAGILNNASATGGLRGGNTQGALARLRPSILSGLITDRLNRLSGVVGVGESAAAGQAAAAQSTGSQVAGILQNQGNTLINADLARGRADAGFYGGIGQSIGTLGLLKLMKGF